MSRISIDFFLRTLQIDFQVEQLLHNNISSQKKVRIFVKKIKLHSIILKVKYVHLNVISAVTDL
jgi:hypothetical protein